MKILQLDVDKIEYELIKPEIKGYEESKEKKASIKDAIVLLTSVEKGDNTTVVKQAISDAVKFADNVKRSKIVVYPFAHLSSDLEEPQKAKEILHEMLEEVKKTKLELFYAPFGWNKKLMIDIKGHPLAEQAKTYGVTAKNVSKKIATHHEKVEVNTAIIKKSDWSGLPDTDHRTIGERLDLYSFQEVSPGMAYWHPNGYMIYKELFKYIREKLDEYGYKEVATPAFANMALWQMSGHSEHYKDNMYVFEAEGQEYGLKPMNCPSSILLYKARKWSYRDLPIRFADFDKLYRNEISGALTGLFRVREITQDDAHLFVREDQIQAELFMVLKMVRELYEKFGLEYKAKLSTMPDDHTGEKEEWDKATEHLKEALTKSKMKFEIKDKEGAFYGPKIDFDIKDSLGREWQCATVQLDYQMPKKFNLEYTGEDGKEHRPAIIHRVIYGSLERFLGVLIEHLQGNFPTWLSPMQVRVITISEPANAYGKKVFEELQKAGIRAELDDSDKTLEYKIRDAQLMKTPYMLVVGQKEIENNTVAVRTRSGGQKFGVKIEDFVEKIKKEIKTRVSGPIK